MAASGTQSQSVTATACTLYPTYSMTLNGPSTDDTFLQMYT